MSTLRTFIIAAVGALAFLLATETPGNAAPRGGGGGGGRGPAGGGYGGAYRGYYGGGNYGRGYYGGGYYGPGNYRGGYYGGGYYGYGLPYGYYRPYGYGYGSYVPIYSSGLVGVGYANVPDGAAAQQEPAFVTVNAPESADVWFAGIKATKEGPKHKFRTKPLDPGRKYNYNVKAKWTNEDGKEFEKTKVVSVRAGKRAVVNFAE